MRPFCESDGREVNVRFFMWLGLISCCEARKELGIVPDVMSKTLFQLIPVYASAPFFLFEKIFPDPVWGIFCTVRISWLKELVFGFWIRSLINTAGSFIWDRRSLKIMIFLKKNNVAQRVGKYHISSTKCNLKI